MEFIHWHFTLFIVFWIGSFRSRIGSKSLVCLLFFIWLSLSSFLTITAWVCLCVFLFVVLISPCFACVGTFFSFATAATAMRMCVCVCVRTFVSAASRTQVSVLSLFFPLTWNEEDEDTHRPVSMCRNIFNATWSMWSTLCVVVRFARCSSLLRLMLCDSVYDD